jgi:hypothetical protein
VDVAGVRLQVEAGARMPMTLMSPETTLAIRRVPAGAVTRYDTSTEYVGRLSSSG